MKKTISYIIVCCSMMLLLFSSCERDMPMDKGVSLVDIPYEPKEFVIEIPDFYPKMTQPSDNIATQAGVDLGRFLFYDPILSIDSTIACASCHIPELAFTDGTAVSSGVNGLTGRRSSMSLVNIGFVPKGFFWDGRAASLEEQVAHPINDPVEMANSWDNLIPKLQESEMYREKFRRAFGIDNSLGITKNLVEKALAQFQRTIVSKGESKYEKVVFSTEPYVFTDEELNGFEMFFHELNAELPDAECSHCHSGPLMTTHGFFNNGLSDVKSYADFKDLGQGGAMMPVDTFRIGKFRAPSLLNIELTGPYMHDGRFQSLDEVVEHYNSGVHQFDNVDSNLRELGLTESQKSDIVAFLKTLTDTSFLEYPHIHSPF